MKSNFFIVSVAACLVSMSSLAQGAEDAKVSTNVITLEASASSQIPFDTVQASYFVEQVGRDPALLADTANRISAEALSEIKRAHGVSVHSGGYSTYPTYDRDNQPTGWRLRSELIVESRDFKTLSGITAKLSGTMALSSLNFSLSDDARRSEEARLLDEAIKAFRAKAMAATKAFGLDSFTVREVSIRTGGGNPAPRLAMASSLRVAVNDIAPVPVEGGKVRIELTVSGSVYMR